MNEIQKFINEIILRLTDQNTIRVYMIYRQSVYKFEKRQRYRPNLQSRFRAKFKFFLFFLSRWNEKKLCSNEKLSRSNEKLSRTNEILSRSNEKLSRSNEKFSRISEKIISF